MSLSPAKAKNCGCRPCSCRGTGSGLRNRSATIFQHLFSGLSVARRLRKVATEMPSWFAASFRTPEYFINVRKILRLEISRAGGGALVVSESIQGAGLSLTARSKSRSNIWKPYSFRAALRSFAFSPEEGGCFMLLAGVASLLLIETE